MQASSLPPTSQRQIQPGTTDLFALGRTGTSLHPELRSALRLNTAHQQKIYYSSRLSKRVERCTDGTRPKDEGWADVWCQLAGVGLSIWSMQAMKHANARGEGVPLQYINVADAFVQVLGSVTFPATPTAPAKRYTNVLTLTTRGSNLLLFVCESPAVLISWAAALRLAAWEKSRLEEIYTAHLLRIAFTEVHVWKEPRTTLVNGRLEGWVRVRVANQTEWRRCWLVISAGSPPPQPNTLSRLFSRSSRSRANSIVSTGDTPNMLFFNSSKPKDRNNPVLSVSSVTQVFAVYPERPELIMKSALVKIEGRLGHEEGAGAIKGAEGWLLIMPEAENGQLAGPSKMLEWVVALHDAFKLYGRPQRYSFDPRDPTSMFFAYPLEPNLEQLFLERELAESIDIRDDATVVVRSRLATIVGDRLRAPPTPPLQSGATGIGIRAEPKPERPNATDYASHNPDSALTPFPTPHSPQAGPIPAPFPTENATDYASRSPSPVLHPFLKANATDYTRQSPSPIPAHSFLPNATHYVPRSPSPTFLPSPTANTADSVPCTANATDYARYTSGPSVPGSPVADATDEFARIDPNETMAKASTLRDTLPAGLQDKHDWPANHQETLAPIAGPSSHIPNESPPPQAGLLSAVTGHEHERGRERKKRMAGERYHKLDDEWGQQVEAGQLMYAGEVDGVSPMITGAGGIAVPMGMMSFSPVMGALDPQQHFQILAAQRAAVEAYQRTMLSFSQGRSVAPGRHDGAE